MYESTGTRKEWKRYMKRKIKGLEKAIANFSVEDDEAMKELQSLQNELSFQKSRLLDETKDCKGFNKGKLRELKNIFEAIDTASAYNEKDFPYSEKQASFNQQLKEYLKSCFGNDITFDREETFAYIQAHFKGVGIEINVHGGIILSIENSDAAYLIEELDPIFTEITGMPQICQYNYCSIATGTKTSYPTAEWHKRPNERLTELIHKWNCTPLENMENFEDYYTQRVIDSLGDNIFTVDGYVSMFEGVIQNYDMQQYKSRQIQKQFPNVTLDKIYDWIESSKSSLSLTKK